MKKINVSIIIFLIKQTISQYDVYNQMQEYQYPYQNLQYQQYHQEYHSHRWKEEDYNEYDENSCDCDKCDQLKPGCLSSCPNCLQPPQSIIPPNYVFLPIPYPYPISNRETVAPETTESKTRTTLTTTSTTRTTTTEATTLMTSTEATEATEATESTESTVSEATQSIWPEETVMTMSPFHVKPKNPYMVTSLRKTKPHWIPKYGIVPISDTFAEKLMLQLRNMKVLHPRKDYSRGVDEISNFK